MKYPSAAKEIIKMKDYDLQERKRLADTGELYDGYNKKMEKVHIENGERLENIINQIGWPTKDKVGQQAKEAAMLIVQHAISLPEFQRSCLKYINEAINQKLEDKKNYAFLYDRICFNERRPQKFGTQFDWDKNGQMSPWTIENPAGVNALRQKYGLNTIEEATTAIRKRVSKSIEASLDNYEIRQQKIYEWSLNVGWIK